jgi:hypothetical protein
MSKDELIGKSPYYRYRIIKKSLNNEIYILQSKLRWNPFFGYFNILEGSLDACKNRMQVKIENDLYIKNHHKNRK